MNRKIRKILSDFHPFSDGDAATPERSSGAPGAPRHLTRRSALGVLASACLALAAPSGVRAASDASGDLATKGRELLLSGKPGEAVTALKEAARLDPANPWVFNLLGRAYSQAGQPYQAAESFRTALRIDPADGYSRMMLDMLSQNPVPVPKGESRPTRHARKSQLEEDAAREFEAYAASGKPPGERLIVLDAGHGGTDKGVSGASGLAEKAVALELVQRIARIFAEQGRVQAIGARSLPLSGNNAGQKNGSVPGPEIPRILLTREADHDQPLWARAATAGLFGADLFISLHCTASLPGHSGLELYTYAPEASDAQAQAVADMENGVTRFERSLPPRAPLPAAPGFLASWQTRRLAGASRLLADRLAAELKAEKPQGVPVRGAPLKVLFGARCPALVVQAGFLSSSADEAQLKMPETLDKLASSLAGALTRCLG